MGKNTETPVKLSELSQEELVKLAEKQAGEIVGLTSANKKLKEDNKVLFDLNEELQKAAEESASAPSVPEVKVGDKVYKIVIPKFTLNGLKRTAADVQKDPALAKELVKIESGVLKLKGG